jgi:hypothetical protein
MLPSNGNVFTELLPRNGCCLQSHCLAADLYATIHNRNAQKQMMQMIKKQCTIIILHFQFTSIWGDLARLNDRDASRDAIKNSPVVQGQ